LLIPHLSGFKAAYPDIDLILGVSDHRVDLLGEGVDLVLRLGPLSVMYPDRQYLAPQTRAFIDWTIAFSKIWTVRGSGRSEAGSWPKRKHQWVILSGRGLPEGPNRRIVCAAPSCLERYGTPQHPEDLGRHECLLMRFGADIEHMGPFLIGAKRRGPL
jgi:DNA-binding transcriptional LysR family regulator